jgi:hypothetical protein
MRIILSTAIYCFSSAIATTTVAPEVQDMSIDDDPFSTPTKKPRLYEHLWAPNGLYDGSERDREEYLRQFRPESPVASRTPERLTQLMTVPPAPRAPRGPRPVVSGFDPRFIPEEWVLDDAGTVPPDFMASLVEFNSPTKPSQVSESVAPWAPRGTFSGLPRDRAEYLASLVHDGSSEDDDGMRTPDRAPRTEENAPWAPNRGYNGLEAGRAEYLRRFPDDDFPTTSTVAFSDSTTQQLRGPSDNGSGSAAKRQRRSNA